MKTHAKDSRSSSLRLFSDFLVVVLFFGANVARAQFSSISYQGRLSDTNGSANGNFQMQFSVYDAGSGPNLLWQETHSSVGLSNGLFSVILGESVPLDATVFNGGVRW